MRTVLFAAVVFAATLLAQSTGEIAGTVKDASGAAAPSAVLVLTNDQTGVAMNGAPNAVGYFRFGNLPPGRYTLSARQSGFTETKVAGIVVEVNRIASVEVTLQVASTQQTVEVTASSQLLDLESSAKGQIITADQMRNLPLQTRNPLALMPLTPGVASPTGGRAASRQGSDGTGLSSNYSINGGTKHGQGGYQEYIVDGISITNQRDGSISGLPGTDSLAEFRVQSGGMSAEFGRTVGGVVNYVTRGGANDFHGNLFEFHRSTATNARLALPATASKPPNVYNQFGGSIGGPVLLPKLYNGRNRTFFFFGYDGSRWVRNNPQLGSVPTVRMKQGDFGEIPGTVYDPDSNANATQRTPFPGDRIPASRFNRFGKMILDRYPDPNRTGLASNIQGVFRVLTPVDNYSARGDHNITDRQRVMFRYTTIGSTSDQTWPLGVNDSRTSVINFPSRTLTGNYTYAVTPAVVYYAALGVTSFHRYLVDASGNQDGAGFFGHTVSPVNPAAYTNTRPLGSFEVYDAIGTSSAQNQIARSVQLNQNVAWVRGKHTLRIGADLRWYKSAGLLTGGASNGSFSFNSLQTSRGVAGTGNSAASGLLGLAAGASFSQPPELNARKGAYGIFVQDDFKIASRLTLNLGIRWDGEGALAEENNCVGYFDSAANNPLVGRAGLFRYAALNGAARQIVRRDFNNWSPRVGFAYAIGADRKMALRGAFGAYNGPVPTSGYFAAAPGFEPSLQYVAPGGGAAALVLKDSYALPPASGPVGDSAYLGQGFGQPVDRVLNVPRIYQWNFGVQREVLRNTTFEVLYTGNRGTKLFSSLGINLPDAAVIEQALRLTGTTGNPTAAFNFLNERQPNPLSGKVPGTLGGATLTRSQLSVPYPHFAGITNWPNNRDLIYHAMQATLQRRFSGDLSFLVAYTFSKQIENIAADAASTNLGENVGALQNPYNLRDARAVGAFDRPHYFSSTVLYALPFGKGKRMATGGWPSAIFGGFQINAVVVAHSGGPMSPQQSASNGLGVGAGRPDILANAVTSSEAIRGKIAPNGGVSWLDRTSFALVNGRFGTSPMRIAQLRGPKFWQLDLGLQRDFKIYERLSFRFRAEAFNAFNHRNLYNPVQNLSSADFGVINSVFDPRIFQFGLELRF